MEYLEKKYNLQHEELLKKLSAKDKEISELKAENERLKSGKHEDYPWARRFEMYEEQIKQLESQLEKAVLFIERAVHWLRDYKRDEEYEEILESISCNDSWNDLKEGFKQAIEKYLKENKN